DELDGPVGRLHTLPVSHPFAPVLERAMLVDSARIVAGVRQVMAGTPPVPDHWHAPGLAAADAPAPLPEPPAEAPAAAAAAPSEAASVDGDEPITMPFGDLTVSEGTLVKWLKAVGDAV